MGSSIKLGRVFGIDIGIHWSWIFIFLVVTWSFATGVFDEFYPQWSTPQRWIGGGAIALVFFLSVLAHELSHAIIANRNGLPVRSITLFVFGGVANLTREPDSAGVEFRIAIVGPLTSLALGAFFAALWLIFRNLSEGFAGICANLALINTSLAVFNMLPGFPLDGGRVFRSAIWARNHDRLRATRIAAKTGEWIAYGVMGIGIAYTFFGGYFSGIWFLLIGFFLRNASTASYDQLVIETTLNGIYVRDVMQRDVDTIAPDVTIDELVHDYVLKRNKRCFAVVAAGEFAGLITLADIRLLPREDWPSMSVYRAMTPVTKLHTVTSSETMTQVLQLMSQHDVNQLPVVDRRELVGLLTRSDVMRFIEVRRDLDDHPGRGVPDKRDAAPPPPDAPVPTGLPRA